MILNIIPSGEEPESTIKVKLWPVVSLLIAGLVSLGVYVSGHEARICVVEKTTISVERKVDNLDNKIEQIAKDQDLFFSLREPRWKEWKKWNEKKRKNGNGVK